MFSSDARCREEQSDASACMRGTAYPSPARAIRPQLRLSRQRHAPACGGALHRSPPLTCSSAAQPAAELVDLIQGLVADPHLPGLAAVVDRDRKPEHVFERLFNRASVRVLHATSPGLRFGAAAEVGLGDGFHVPDAQALLDDPTRDSYGIRDSKKRTRMPGRDPALDNKVLDLWREVEKPDHVVHVRPALTEDLGRIRATGAGPRRLMLLIGEVKEFAPARSGHKLVVKHLPEHSFLLSEALHRRMTARVEREITLWDAVRGAHLIVTLGLSRRITSPAATNCARARRKVAGAGP